MTHKIGEALWHDLTVDDAVALKDFYAAVVGWQSKAVEMGGYQDFSMQSPQSGQDCAGICHARGTNAQLPPQWLVYFAVADLDIAIAEVKQRGGKCLTDIKGFGDSRYLVIEDPAGAVCALFQEPKFTAK